MKLTKFRLGGIPAKKLESNDATPFMNFFKFLIPGFKQAYDQKLAQQNYDAKMKAQYKVRVPLQEVPSSVYKPKVQLAKKPTIAQNKPITKHQFGDKLPTAQSAEQRYRNGTRSQVASKYYGDSVSIRGVTGPSKWYQKPPIILEKIRHDRVNPAYNDTTYAEQPAYTPPIRVQERAAGNNILLQGKKQRFNFFGNFFNTNYNPSTPQEQNEYDTLKRRFNTAWGIAKHQFGTTKGGIQPSDNTRVQKPLIPGQQIQQKENRIPWGAGKGQAGQNPLVYLWNNPYVAGTMMAMSPLVKPKVQYDIFPVKEVLKFSFLPQKEIMTRMTTKYGNYQNIKGPKGRINAWKIEKQPGVDNLTEIQNLLFK